MTREELDEIKALIFDYIFPEPAFNTIAGLRPKLEDRGVLDVAYECFKVCQDFAKELIDKELEKIKEEKRNEWEKKE